jgi:hypothetical protein
VKFAEESPFPQPDEILRCLCPWGHKGWEIMREITFREAIREALVEEMEKDPTVFILGENVAERGGVYQVTKEFWIDLERTESLRCLFRIWFCWSSSGCCTLKHSSYRGFDV